MKKKAAPKRDLPQAQPVPDLAQMMEMIEQAAYGGDAGNPLLRQLLRARNGLVVARGEAPGLPLTAALRKVARLLKKPADAWADDSEFYEAVFQALLHCDAGFFREVARLLETRVSGPERRLDLEMIRAYCTLCSEAKEAGRPLPPTKREIRENALFALALENVCRRNPSPNTYADMYEDSEDDDDDEPLTLKAEVQKEVMKEVERISDQNWTRIFKRCGLAHLPSDKGGRRSHRARRG